jgi:soluble lytic murein transglycosylase-like protein
MLERKFGARYWFAYAVMQQESDCNPGAHNFKWSGWHNQAQGIAQMIPKYHTWVNFKRLKHDLNYAIACFLRLSKNGTNGQPWGM